MGTIRVSANASFRDYVVDGVASTGYNQVLKSDVRVTFGVVEDRIANLEATSTSDAIAQPTWASLVLLSGSFYGQKAEVYADGGTHTDVLGGTVNNTGVYSWVVGSGWHWISADAVSSKAPIASPVLTGSPQSVTPAATDDSTLIATTAFAKHMSSPAFVGSPTSVTGAATDSSTLIATTAFAKTMDSPAFVGRPTVPTPALGDASTVTANMAAVAAGLEYALSQALAAAGATPAQAPTDTILNASRINAANGSTISPFAPIVAWMLGSGAFQAGPALSFGDVVALAAGATRYYGIGRSSASQNQACWVCDRTGFVRGLYAYVDISPGAGQSATLTLMKNGVATALACVIPGTGSTTAGDRFDQVACAPYDVFEIRAVMSGGAATANALSATLSIGV